MVGYFLAFPIKLYNFIKGFVTSKKSQPIFENKIESTYKITKEDIEKSSELFEQKLVTLSQKFFSQTLTSDDYNPQTEYYQLIGEDGRIQCIPVTEL